MHKPLISYIPHFHFYTIGGKVKDHNQLQRGKHQPQMIITYNKSLKRTQGWVVV